MKYYISKCCICLLLCLSISPVFTQYKHQDVFPDDTSYVLINKLVQSFKPSYVLDYAQARVKMYKEIYNNQDSVRCVYTHHTLYLDPMASDPIGDLIKNGDPNGINCEHTFPQSKGANDGNAKSDMHHLFPVRAAVNEARSNFPFEEIADHKTINWYYKSNNQSSIPSHLINEYSESGFDAFEPREDFKGNIARAIFYFYTMYELQSDRNYFEAMKATLCEWHINDPVDSLEWHRNYMIAYYQDQKLNPFILDCSLIKRSYCTTSTSCKLNTATITSGIHTPLIYVDVNNFINIQFDAPQKFAFELINLTGQSIIHRNGINNTNLQISADNLLAGSYILIIKFSNGFRYAQGILLK